MSLLYMLQPYLHWTQSTGLYSSSIVSLLVSNTIYTVCIQSTLCCVTFYGFFYNRQCVHVTKYVYYVNTLYSMYVVDLAELCWDRIGLGPTWLGT